MNDANLILFLAASLVVIVAPGPDNMLVLTRGVTLGRKATLVSAAGASTGLVCHSLFAAAGLSAILERSAVAYSVVKYVGAAYLIYLGVRTLMNREAFVLSEDGATPALGLRRVYLQALASNVFNPKIAVFFLAYLPQFADRSPGGSFALQLPLQLLVLGLIFAAMTWATFSAIALLSGALGGWLRSRPKLVNGLSWLTGGVLVALGLRLALPEVNAWMVQPSTGAEAEGTWHDTCTEAPQLWNTSSIPSQNSSSFEEGPAEVCATAWTRSNNGTTDMFQGCSEVEAAPTA